MAVKRVRAICVSHDSSGISDRSIHIEHLSGSTSLAQCGLINEVTYVCLCDHDWEYLFALSSNSASSQGVACLQQRLPTS